MAEVGVDIMRSRVVKFWLCRMHQNRHQTFEASEEEIEHKGELEAHQQGQCAWGVQRSAAAHHNDIR